MTAPPRPTTSLPAGPVSSFQGQVAAVDAQVGEILVAVQIVWAPVMKAGAHERRVLVDPHTRWDPPQVTLAGLRAGEEVQIKALDSDDGTWRAVEVQLIDID